MGLAALLGRVDRRRAYLAIPVGLCAVVLAERVALLTDGRWISVLWLTVALAILLQNVFISSNTGVVTDTRRAKRLFPLFAGRRDPRVGHEQPDHEPPRPRDRRGEPAPRLGGLPRGLVRALPGGAVGRGDGRATEGPQGKAPGGRGRSGT